MVERVWVVLGETGEYSDREVWLCGVFRSDDEAKKEVVARTAVRRAYDAWQNLYYSEMRRAERLFRSERGGGYLWQDEAAYKAAEAAARQRAGPKPAYEPAERCSLIVCPIGQWGQWTDAKESALSEDQK